MDDTVAGYLTSEEAAEALGVKRQTLYTYASRGLIRLVPASDGKRRLYLAADVERLRSKAQAHRGEAAVAAGALQWGEPVVDSALTQIDVDGPNYRGVPALELVERGVRWEAVAELLWTGELGREPWATVELELPWVALAGLVPRGAPPLSALQVMVALLGAADPMAVGAPAEADRERARGLSRRLVAGLALAAPRAEDWRARMTGSLSASSTALALARVTGLPDAAAEDLDAALVLCADHELNASAFAARVAAGAGCDLYGMVAAALATLTGPRHGGACDRVEALLAEVGEPGRAAEVLGARLRRGESIPGFGHPLYPGGDPRAEPLLERVRGSKRNRAKVALAVRDAMAAAGHPAPTVDFGLVALCAHLDLPRGWASALFAVGRFAGWAAHGWEQRSSGVMLRPRARYTGP